MEFSLQEGAAAPWVWTVAFALSLISGAAAGFELFFYKEARSRWIRGAVRCGLVLLALLAMADCCGWSLGLSDTWQLPARAGVIGVGLLAILFVVRATSGSGRRSAAGFAILSVVAVSWSAARIVAFDEPGTSLEGSYVQSANERLAPLNQFAHTDAGREVPLFHCPEPAGTNRLTGQPQTTVSPDLLARVIAVAPPSDKTNCHGWVFTGGRFVVRGAAIDSVLRDNGYRQVDVPKSGDLIVYRDDAGIPSHTGVVKATGRDGYVLIESKWGFDGLFLHEPQDQCYTQEFAYYRSSRSGHLLRLDGTKPVGTPTVTPDPLVLSAVVGGT